MQTTKYMLVEPKKHIRKMFSFSFSSFSRCLLFTVISPKKPNYSLNIGENVYWNEKANERKMKTKTNVAVNSVNAMRSNKRTTTEKKCEKERGRREKKTNLYKYILCVHIVARHRTSLFAYNSNDAYFLSAPFRIRYSLFIVQ